MLTDPVRQRCQGGCMSTGPQQNAPRDGDGPGRSPLSWLGRARLFVPLICALLLAGSIISAGDTDWWRWAAVGGLLLLQALSLAVHARSR